MTYSVPSPEFRSQIVVPLLPGGISLSDASQETPLLIVFLRHSGCTFCRETLAKLRDFRSDLDAKKIKLILVHMSSDEDAKEFFSSYNLGDAWRISDPAKSLYKAFGLQRGTLQQVLGLKSFTHGIFNGAIFKHGIGMPKGDTFQMPGTFLLYKGEILKAHVPNSAAEEALDSPAEFCTL